METFRTANNLDDIFHTPLSIQAWNQLQSLKEKIPQQSTKADIWKCHGQSKYSSMSPYNNLIKEDSGSPLLKLLWKSANGLKHKIFSWLMFQNRINTRSLLQRKGMHLENYDCVCCRAKSPETPLHLFWDCQFAHSCW